jgi:aminoglycoside 3-N-acetyltransferase
MIIPETGPDNNGLEYGSGRDLNKMAEFFSEDMPADQLMGVVAEKIRLYPHSKRSTHPILSFAGIQLADAFEAQTLNDPLAPIQWLLDQNGYVLLLGVDHTVNTSIHLAEQKAGRKTFVRWALTPRAIVACPGFPGCSEGFNQAAIHLTEITSVTKIGDANLIAMPIREMVEILIAVLQADPFALLCEKENCPRCQATRNQINLEQGDDRNA